MSTTPEREALAARLRTACEKLRRTPMPIVNVIPLMQEAADALAASPAAGAPETWRDMASAPKDGTLLRLLVDFEDHATEDSSEPCATIGANNLDHTDVDEWQFAGWSWQQDCWTQGVGKPVGWLPMLAATPPAAPAQAMPQGALEVLAAWAEKHSVKFVSRSYGQRTTDTVSRDALYELAALASQEGAAS